jgi:hypothetical protein
LATEFYMNNKAVMDAGAEVSWSERIRDGEINALHTVENLLIETGPQFWAEYQNEPKDIVQSTYKLEPKQVLSHISNLPVGRIPDQSRVLVAGVDINRAGLHWVVVAFDQQMGAHVAVYGRWPEGGEVWPENATDSVKRQGIFNGLAGLCRHIAQLPFLRGEQRIMPARVLIDRGYEPEAVHQFARAAAFPFKVIPCRGYAAQKYGPRKNTLVGAPFEQGHITESPQGQYIAFNADHFRELMQRAWMGESGIPGGATLFQADPRQHIIFADHIVAEKLRQKYLTDSGMRWEWAHEPGVQWDWADAMSMSYVAAASMGVNSQGVYMIKRPAAARRKAKVEIQE